MIGLAIASAQLADLLTFVCMTRVLPISAEGNPFAVLIFQHAGWLGVVGFKAVGIALLIAIALRLTGQRRVLLTAAAVGFGLVGALSNTLGVMAYARPL